MHNGRPTDAQGSTIGAFLRARWHGEAPLDLVFWRDMVVVGTAINLAFTLVAAAMLAMGFPLAVVLVVHFLPLPYNIFLFVAVLRSSSRAGGWTAWMAPLAAAAWLALSAVI